MIGFGQNYVTNTNDNGVGSLRYNINNANNGDTIRFLDSLLGGTIFLTSGNITINKSLKIIGLYNCHDTLKISGNNIYNIFDITGNTFVQLDSLYLFDGKSNTYGGAIIAQNDSLNINNSFIINNTAQSGGGISSSFSTVKLTINNSLIKGNKANYRGGGVYCPPPGSLKIFNSTIASNMVSDTSVTPSQTTVSGGGICTWHIGQPGDTLQIINSTFYDNRAIVVSGDTNGTYHFAAGGAIRAEYAFISHSTIYNNIATSSDMPYVCSYGGGVSASYLELINSTITANTSSANSLVSNCACCHGMGGGLYVYNLDVSGSIVSGNSSGSLEIDGSSSGPTSIYNSFGYNLFGDLVIPGFTSLATDFMGNSNPMLGLLQNNGGNTKTLAPILGSPVIDMGDPLDISLSQNQVAPIIRDIGSTEFSSDILGCTDYLACNYDASATLNNWNCCYGSSDASYDTITVVTGYYWGAYYLTSSGDYTDTLINSAGCDSIVNLNLTVTTTDISEIFNGNRKLLKITNTLGQETPNRRNTPLFYIYDDGTVEKRIVIE